jgi:SAM-dependent MidA family methyltransferase
MTSGRSEAQALPPPDPEALAHAARLVALIRSEIDACGGSIGFDRYMELALYAPGLGYYSAGLTKLGPGGDFVTAPEISPIFGRCLALWCAEVLETLGGGEVLELGAGTGRLAAQLLSGLRALGRLPGRFAILEPSADLRARQRDTLAADVPDLLPRIAWLDRLPETPLTGLVIANEVADALPVRRFVLLDAGVFDDRVGWEGGGFAWAERSADPELAGEIERIRREHGLSAPYRSELRPLVRPWLSALAGCLARGVLLFIDYGCSERDYYARERRDGTLLCHYRHRAHADPLVLTGLQDITAWLDFTALARAGGEAGLDLLGYATQAHFLIDCGLDRALAELQAPDPDRYLVEAQSVKRLILPGEMGEHFKALALGRGVAAPLPGFRRFDRRDRL